MTLTLTGVYGDHTVDPDNGDGEQNGEELKDAPLELADREVQLAHVHAEKDDGGNHLPMDGHGVRE